jgi:hypothetical protein
MVARDVAALEAALRGLCGGGGERALRRAAGRLLRDIAAVGSGLRPAFMLDYAPCRPETLARAAAFALPAFAAAPPQCVVAVLADGCCLLVAAPPPPPLFVAFDLDPRSGAAPPRWATASEAAAAAEGLGAVRRALDAARRAAVDGAIPIIDLAAVEGAPCMPTANGWLLGYPAAYLVEDEVGAAAAARALSSATLVLHTAAAELRGGACTDAALLGFSVPASLAGDAAWAARRTAWRAALRARHAAAAARGAPWGPLQLEEASCLRAIAL